jgi:hypothetical protein
VTSSSLSDLLAALLRAHPVAVVAVPALGCVACWGVALALMLRRRPRG